MRLDVIGALVVLMAALLSIINRTSISPSLLALTLSEALDVTMFLKSAVRTAAMFESRFNSVERLCAYKELEPEAPRRIADKRSDICACYRVINYLFYRINVIIVILTRYLRLGSSQVYLVLE